MKFLQVIAKTQVHQSLLNYFMCLVPDYDFINRRLPSPQRVEYLLVISDRYIDFYELLLPLFIRLVLTFLSCKLLLFLYLIKLIVILTIDDIFVDFVCLVIVVFWLYLLQSLLWEETFNEIASLSESLYLLLKYVMQFFVWLN